MWGKTRKAIWCIHGEPRLKRAYVSLGNPKPTLLCLNKEGELLWDLPTKGPVNMITSAPLFGKIYLHRTGRNIPRSLMCVDTGGRLKWNKTFDAAITSIDTKRDADLCLLGTADSQVIVVGGNGRVFFRRRLEGWKNDIYAYFNEEKIIAVSERGLLHIVGDLGKRKVKQFDIDLRTKVGKFKIRNGYLGFLDYCFGRNNTLHLFNPLENSYYDLHFERAVKDFFYNGEDVTTSLKNSILVSVNENTGFRGALDLRERILDLHCDYVGGHLLAGTDNFRILLFDKNLDLIWGMNSRGEHTSPSTLYKRFEALGPNDVLLEEEEERECISSTKLVENLEQILITIPDDVVEAEESGKEVAEEEIEGEEEWVLDDAGTGKPGLIRNFKPIEVEKKVSVKPHLSTSQGCPVLFIQMENTTKKLIEDLRIFTELDNDIYRLKTNPIEHDMVEPNTAKRFRVRFLPTSISGKTYGQSRINYSVNGEEKEFVLKRFSLKNEWPDMHPADKDIWERLKSEGRNISTDRFTVLSPKYLVPLIEEICHKRNLGKINVEKRGKQIRQYFSAKADDFGLGLRTEINPPSDERSLTLYNLSLYSDDKGGLDRLYHMLTDELDSCIQKEEESQPFPISWTDRGRAPKNAAAKDHLLVPAPEWSSKTWVEIPLWSPERAEGPRYHPSGLPYDYRIYGKYSDYFLDHFTPYPEKPDTVTVNTGRGYIYLFEDAVPERTFKLFKVILDAGLEGMYITREYPQKVMEKYGLENVPYIWLTKVREKNALRPTATEKLRYSMGKFLKDRKKKDGKNKVILLDGVEYLITHNAFTPILKFLQSIKDHISLSNGTLIMPISPSTLKEQKLKLIEREADEIIHGTKGIIPRIF